MASRAEAVLNDRLCKRSKHFLGLLQKAIAENAKDLKLKERLKKKISKMNLNAPLKQQYGIKAPNGRQSKIDLYFDDGDVKIIIELKLGNAGFRCAAQAAYYSNCLEDGHDLVVLLADKEGPDYQSFSKTCLTDKAMDAVAFLTYEEIGLNPLTF